MSAPRMNGDEFEAWQKSFTEDGWEDVDPEQAFEAGRAAEARRARAEEERLRSEVATLQAAVVSMGKSDREERLLALFAQCRNHLQYAAAALSSHFPAGSKTLRNIEDFERAVEFQNAGVWLAEREATKDAEIARLKKALVRSDLDHEDCSGCPECESGHED